MGRSTASSVPTGTETVDRIGENPNLRTLMVTEPTGALRARNLPSESVRWIDPPGVINTLAPTTGNPSES